MSTVVIKLFAGQGTGRTDGRTKRRLYASPLNIQGRIMVLGFYPFPHCNLSIYQALFKCQHLFLCYLPDKVPDERTKRRLYAPPFGSINIQWNYPETYGEITLDYRHMAK